uniref:Uncharacterized protein n=1 Tax=Arundo donax TaxID=35708 RepID=A0A0A8ZJT9_ARUDO
MHGHRNGLLSSSIL